MFLSKIQNNLARESSFKLKLYFGYIISITKNTVIVDFGLKKSFIIKLNNKAFLKTLHVGDRCVCYIDNQYNLLKLTSQNFLINYSFKYNIFYTSLFYELTQFAKIQTKFDYPLLNLFVFCNRGLNTYGLNLFNIVNFKETFFIFENLNVNFDKLTYSNNYLKLNSSKYFNNFIKDLPLTRNFAFKNATNINFSTPTFNLILLLQNFYSIIGQSKFILNQTENKMTKHYIYKLYLYIFFLKKYILKYVSVNLIKIENVDLMFKQNLIESSKYNLIKDNYNKGYHNFASIY